MSKSSKFDTAYLKSLRASIDNGESLRANRRGLVGASDDSEKPIFTIDELHKSRKLGVSYKSLAKKLGIDKSKDEVLHICTLLQQSSDGTLPDVESIKTPYRRSYPTPLWFLWSSEQEIVANSVLPSEADLMSENPHIRVVKHLGEDAEWMLQAYLQVQQVVQDELINTFQYASQDSPIGQQELWTNHIPKKVMQKALDLEKRVGEAAYLMTNSWKEEKGRCRCGGLKVLKFKWKTHPLEHPSLFWGCVKYNRADPHQHDKAKSCSGTVWDAMNQYCNRMIPSDLRQLHQKCSQVQVEWISRKDDDIPDTELELMTKFFGGEERLVPFRFVSSICSALERLCGIIDSAIPENST